MNNHYFKDVSGLKQVDVYRVLKLFGVTDPCVQHEVKKLLCAGGRGTKGEEQDISEAIQSLERFLAMREEDREPEAAEYGWDANPDIVAAWRNFEKVRKGEERDAAGRNQQN